MSIVHYKSPRVMLAALSTPLLVTAAPLSAQDQGAPIPVVIGTFNAAKQCTLYAVTSGSEAMVARSGSAGYVGPYSAGYARSASIAYARTWRTDLVRDCVSNFQMLRQSMEAAVAASGKFRVVRAGTAGAYSLSGSLTELGGSGSDLQGSGVDQTTLSASITVQFTLKDARGRTVGGNMIKKTVTTGSVSHGANTSLVTTQNGKTTYAELQREAAFAVARAAAFHLVPLRVTEVTDRRVRLNYGTPLISQGDVVLLDGGQGEQIKTNINMAGSGYSWAETRGTGDISRVPIGAIATYAESDSDAANTPVFDRVELPF